MRYLLAESGILIGTAATSYMINVLPASVDPAPDDNQVPTVSNITITDTNGDVAVIGDTLLASYLYFDIEGDAEGQSEIH